MIASFKTKTQCTGAFLVFVWNDRYEGTLNTDAHHLATDFLYKLWLRVVSIVEPARKAFSMHLHLSHEYVEACILVRVKYSYTLLQEHQRQLYTWTGEHIL